MSKAFGKMIFYVLGAVKDIFRVYLRAVVLCVFFVALNAGPLYGTDEPEITVLADRSDMRIGDRINLEISSPVRKGVEIIFPEKPEHSGDFSFISAEPLKRGFLKEKREGKVYSYSIYNTGSHVIPPIKVLYKNAGEDEWKSVFTRQIAVEVASLLDDESQDIRDIRGVFRRGKRLKPIIAAFFIALGIIGALIFWIRKRRKAAVEAASRIRPADEIAYEKLRELKQMKLPEKGMVKEYYIRLSEIVRYYLEGRFSFRAPEMTTEEFLESLKFSPELKVEHKQLLREFLSHCDMVKFAKYGPTPLEVLDSFGSAEKLVDQTRPLEQEEENGHKESPGRSSPTEISNRSGALKGSDGK